MTRLVIFMAFAALGSLCIPVWPAHSSVNPKVFSEVRSIGEAFTGEELVYEIDFWVFKEVAVGSVKLENPGKGDFVGTITARTTGVANLFLNDRKETYIERMEMIDGGKRFRTKSFEESLEINGKVRHKQMLFDYENGVMRSKSWGGGRKERVFEVKLEPGVFYDGPLTTLYNFRYGAYGPFEVGKVYNIKTLPKSNKYPEINLKYNGGNGNSPADYMVSVLLKKDITGSKSGSIDITFKDDMVPTRAIAKDILLFGDLRGKLRQVGYSLGFSKTGRPQEPGAEPLIPKTSPPPGE